VALGSGALVTAFALALALFGGPGYAEPNNVHAAVYQWAAEHPGEHVPIILRTTGNSAEAEGAVTALGGEVHADFDFISSVQAEVPASSLRHIAAAKGVEFISLDAPVIFASGLIDDSKVKSAFPFAVDADDAWNDSVYGRGVGVAVIDTGISPTTNPDFVSGDASRVVASVATSTNATSTVDGYGHGTHIAGIVGSEATLPARDTLVLLHART